MPSLEPLDPCLLDPTNLQNRMSAASQIAKLVSEVYPVADPNFLLGTLGDLTFVVSERGGKRIRGVVSVSWHPPLQEPPVNSGWINVLAVSPSAREKGIGCQLASRAVQTMIGQGLDAIGLASAPTSEQFWHNRGFRRCEPQPPDAHCMNPVMYKFLKKG